MRRFVIVACVGLAAAITATCVDNHHVQLLLGPSATSISNGFQCEFGGSGSGSTDPLIGSGCGPGSATIEANLVVDVIDLGGNYPGCLGEEVIASCNASPCSLQVADAPTRFCKPLMMPCADLRSATAIAGYIHDTFPDVISLAPHRPVIVRAVVTNQSCAEIEQNDGTNWVSLTTAGVLGCAYSCPVVLDDISGTVSLGIDIGSASLASPACASAIRTCATFPK